MFALPGFPPSVRVVDAPLAGEPARYIAVVPDADNRFPRVRNGEIGLVEGWELARAVHGVVEADRDQQVKRPIVAVVDATSQAYGRREEADGIHLTLDLLHRPGLPARPVAAVLRDPRAAGLTAPP